MDKLKKSYYDFRIVFYAKLKLLQLRVYHHHSVIHFILVETKVPKKSVKNCVKQYMLIRSAFLHNIVFTNYLHNIKVLIINLIKIQSTKPRRVGSEKEGRRS